MGESSHLLWGGRYSANCWRYVGTCSGTVTCCTLPYRRRKSNARNSLLSLTSPHYAVNPNTIRLLGLCNVFRYVVHHFRDITHVIRYFLPANNYDTITLWVCAWHVPRHFHPKPKAPNRLSRYILQHDPTGGRASHFQAYCILHSTFAKGLTPATRFFPLYPTNLRHNSIFHITSFDDLTPITRFFPLHPANNNY
jgi:hypothetical protein